MRSIRIKTLCSASVLALASTFAASGATAASCTVISPATDVLLAKMIGQITDAKWINMVPTRNAKPESEAEAYNEAWIETVGGGSFYEEVWPEITAITGGLEIQGRGDLFRSLEQCSSIVLPLSAGALKATNAKPKVLREIASKLPGAGVGKGQTKANKETRSGGAITMERPSDLVALYKAIVSGGDLPMGVKTDDVKFSKR